MIVVYCGHTWAINLEDHPSVRHLSRQVRVAKKDDQCHLLHLIAPLTFRDYRWSLSLY